MGEVDTQKPLGNKPPEGVTVGEFGTVYLRLNLDPRDKSLTIDVPENYGWFWLDGADGRQTIDDVIEALELAKQCLSEG